MSESCVQTEYIKIKTGDSSMSCVSIDHTTRGRNTGGAMGCVIPLTLKHGFNRVFLLRGHRFILVDTGSPGCGQEILTRLRQAGVCPEEISLILITHGHFDHWGNARFLKEKLRAPLAVHEADAQRMREGHSGFLRPTCPAGIVYKVCSCLAGRMRGNLRGAEPDLEVEKAFSLRLFGVDGMVIPTPGHTRGSLSVILQSGEAVIGDLLMGGFLRSNRPGWPIFAEDIEAARESLERVLEKGTHTLYPSHGGVLSAKDCTRLLNSKAHSDT